MPRRGPSAANVERISRAYAFLAEHEKRGTSFSIDDLSGAAGWKHDTVTAYLTKKLAKIVQRNGQTLRAAGVSAYTKESFLRLMSQRNDLSADPQKPTLKPEVECLLRKARESALLALQIYNNPTIAFRTEGFSVMMVIAWTALFHAIFEKRGQSYCYTDPATGKPQTRDGDMKAWELSECLNQFYGGTTSPIRTNLTFFIRLRNKIEHRFVPEIDPTVAGECQSLLLNFDELLVAEFGTYFAIRESLAIPLQTAHVRVDPTLTALKKLQARHFEEVNAFVADFRASLPPEILDDQKFCFKVFLIPRLANHAGTAHPIDFVQVTPENEGELAQLNKKIVAIKDRHVAVANAGHLKPSDVVTQVAKRLGKLFHRTHHYRAWQHYEAHRPTKKGGNVTSDGCNTQWCLPDPVHNDYVYTPAWVEFLVKKLADAAEYESLTRNRSAVPPTATKWKAGKGKAPRPLTSNGYDGDRAVKDTGSSRG